MVDTKRDIILFGYGNFGKQLYKNLSKSDYNIRVVSFIDEFIDQAKDQNIDIIKADVKNDEDIKALCIDEQKDLIYCAMNKTADNLFLVLTLRTLYQNAKIIAISNSYENSKKLKYVGADNIIDLYEATSRRVVNILTKPAVTKALDEIIYKQNRLKMAEIKIPKKSFLDGKSIKEIDFKNMGLVLIAIINEELEHKLNFTNHNYRLYQGDTLVVVAMRDDLEVFKQKLRS